MWPAALNNIRGPRRWKNRSRNSSGFNVGKGFAVQESGGRQPGKHIFLLRCLLVGLVTGGLGRGVSAGWIDIDTPQSVYNITSIPLRDTPKKNLKLVMSDEFNTPGRSFEDGDDPAWTALHRNDYTNAALHFYSKDRVTTENGFLKIVTTNEDANVPYWSDETRSVHYLKKNYASGMLQGWNKFCFTGGIVEISAQLPGKSETGGLWPAIWLMGNIARATFTASSDYQWPWSYDKCIINTSAGADGLGLFQPQQELHACDFANHFGMHHLEGRGAPEIDILEVMAGKKPSHTPPHIVGKPYGSMSYQVAPGIQGERPLEGHRPNPGLWYEEDLVYGPNASQNVYFYGSKLEHDFGSKTYVADAISANHQLEQTHFEEQHVYRLEWEPGPDGYLRWFIDGKFAFSMNQNTLKKTGSKIPDEPMYILLNTAVSSRWGFPAPCDTDTCACDCFDAKDTKCECAIPDGMSDMFPAEFLVDYVRVYQNPDVQSHKIGCSTDDRPTARWIAGHKDRYHDPQDNHVLFPIKRGGGSCTSSKDCGNGRGTCKKGKCACPKGSGWAGPNCGAPDGFDDIIYEHDIKVPLIEAPILPRGLGMCIMLVVTVFLASVVVQTLDLKERRKIALSFTDSEIE